MCRVVEGRGDQPRQHPLECAGDGVLTQGSDTRILFVDDTFAPLVPELLGLWDGIRVVVHCSDGPPPGPSRSRVAGVCLVGAVGDDDAAVQVATSAGPGRPRRVRGLTRGSRRPGETGAYPGRFSA